MTLIEVVVAAFILAVGIGGTMASFAAPQKQTFTAQRLSQAAAIAEREIEEVAQRPWSTLGMTSLPAPVSDASDAPADPRAHVRAPATCGTPAVSATTCLLVRRTFNKVSDGALDGTGATGEPFVQTTRGVSPSTTVQGATVHRFVTWRDRDPCAPGIEGGGDLDSLLRQVLGLLGGFTDTLTASVLNNRLNVLCLSGQSVKRVTVAVVPPASANQAGPLKPVWLSTVVPSPGAGAFSRVGGRCTTIRCTRY